MKSILFVCLGNICRSPAAEAIMIRAVEARGLSTLIRCDSAGTYGGHAGEPADSRMIRHAAERSIHITSRSRQLRQSDLQSFDMIIGMDRSNVANIRALDRTGTYSEKIKLMTDYCRHISADEVPDPYYGGSEGFERVLDILEDACEGVLDEILATL